MGLIRAIVNNLNSVLTVTLSKFVISLWFCKALICKWFCLCFYYVIARFRVLLNKIKYGLLELLMSILCVKKINFIKNKTFA